jgi:uncharacterized protein (TIGR03067 family)
VGILAVLILGGNAVLLGHRALADKPSGKEADKKTDNEKLQGTWKVVSGESEGKEAPIDELKQATWVFKGDKLIVTKATESHESDYKIDPTQKPKTIDVTPRQGPEEEKDKTFPGIYQLDGDTLKLCMNGPDMERPTEFVTKEGTRLMLLSLKREAAGKEDK